MSKRRTISVDPAALIREDFYTAGDGSYAIRKQQDVTQLLANNKAERDAKGERGQWKDRSNGGLGVKIASIGMLELETLMRKGILTRGFKIADPQAFQDWLDANSGYKTTYGKAL